MNIAELAKNNKNARKINIALVGHMGSGKSTLGKLIAKKLNFTHIDSDKEIEKFVGLKISKIFEIKGEKYFRKIEEKIILNNIKNKNIVLSLGGGSILNKKLRLSLKKNFLSIFLDVDIPTLIKRLRNSKHRPLLMNINIENKIKELDLIRRKYYLLSELKLKNHDNITETLNEFNNKYIEFYDKNSH